MDTTHYPHNVNGETRTRAFKMALKDMTENFDLILILLRKKGVWDRKLQISVIQKFT
jgi:hypothetical protein